VNTPFVDFKKHFFHT